MPHWQPGDPILLREIYRGRVWAARPVRVIEDAADRVAVYMAPGTRWKRPVGVDGNPLRLQSATWDLVDATWDGNAALRIFVPGRAHSVLTWWDPETWEFQGWYVNLEEPMRRTAVGFDYLDQVLDNVVTPDRRWRWKDEDEFARAQAEGILDPVVAVAIRSEGERVIRAIEAGDPPFVDGARAWRPDPSWSPPGLAPGWDVVPGK